MPTMSQVQLARCLPFLRRLFESGSGAVSGEVPDGVSPEASVSSEAMVLLQLRANRKVVKGVTTPGQSPLRASLLQAVPSPARSCRLPPPPSPLPAQPPSSKTPAPQAEGGHLSCSNQGAPLPPVASVEVTSSGFAGSPQDPGQALPRRGEGCCHNWPPFRISLHAALCQPLDRLSAFAEVRSAAQVLGAVVQGVSCFFLYADLSQLECESWIREAALSCFGPFDQGCLPLGSEVHGYTDGSQVQSGAAWAILVYFWVPQRLVGSFRVWRQPPLGLRPFKRPTMTLLTERRRLWLRPPGCFPYLRVFRPTCTLIVCARVLERMAPGGFQPTVPANLARPLFWPGRSSFCIRSWAGTSRFIMFGLIRGSV